MSTDKPNSSPQRPAQPLKPVAPQPLIPTQTGLEGIDMSVLSQEQRQELTMLAARSKAQFIARASELGLDAQALRSNLETFTAAAHEATSQGTAVTVTNTRDDHLGRTEIIVGNTDQARSGKLTRSQTGAPDRTFVWMGFALLALIIVATAIVKMSRG